MPYLAASRKVGAEARLAEVARYSAHWSVYLATGGRLHYALWSAPFVHGDALFPGVVAIALTMAAIVTGVALRDLRARMVLAIGVVAFAMSFGPAFPPYGWLYSVFPLLTGIRGAVRFGQFFLAAIAILAGFGLAWMQQRVRRGGLALCVALIVVAQVEALRAPFGYTPVSRRATDLGQPQGRGARRRPRLLPVLRPLSIHTNTRYMLMSTHFWTPMLNGYSGFAPPSYFENYTALASFPDRGRSSTCAPAA